VEQPDPAVVAARRRGKRELRSMREGPSVFIHDKVMFEIYREAGYDRLYRVVFFTELDEHNKEVEIARATAGEHYYDGFLRIDTLPQAKRIIAELLERLNRGEVIEPAEVERQLASHQA
jgi:hypothetical protein